MILAAFEIGADYTFTVAGQRFGFMDVMGGEGEPVRSLAVLGPLGIHVLPVSAVTGWGIVAFALLAIVAIAAAFAGRRRKRA